MVKRILLFASLICMFSATVFASDIYENQIRQVYPFSDMMRVYTDVSDNQKLNVEDLDASNFQVFVDNTQMQIKSAKPFSKAGEGIATVFLVDTSKSLSASQMKNLKAAMKKWVSRMTPDDSMAIITFGNDVKSCIDYSNDEDALNAAIDSIVNDGTRTRLYGGISEALKLCSRTDAALPKRKSIMLITDGVNDYKGGISEKDVYDQLKKQLIPVYSLWLPTGGSKGESTLNSVTDYSGGSMYNLSKTNIEKVYDTIYNTQMSTYVLDCAYNSVTPDSNIHSLTVKAGALGKTAEDVVEFNLVKNSEHSGRYMVVSDENQEESPANDKEQPEDQEDTEKGGLSNTVIILIALGVLIVGIIVALIVFLINKNKKDYYTDDVSTGSAEYTQRTSATVNTAFDGQRLVFTSMSTGRRVEVPFTSGVTIGRNKNSGFCVDDPQVSSNNSIVTFENGKLCIEDCNSTNGTFVNGFKVQTKCEFESGSVITVGLSDFRVELEF